MKINIPETGLQRLPVYLNYLKSLGGEKVNISSGAIARALGMGEVLVRKDLAFTSAEGKTRVGYNTGELIAAIEDYLGCNDKKNAVIFGAGGLGCALLSYGGFNKYGIEIVAAFDNDPEKFGKTVAGKPVLNAADAATHIKNLNAKLAVICVPAKHAQAVADVLVACGVKSILNFAPVRLNAPAHVTVRHIDLAGSLAVLSSISEN